MNKRSYDREIFADAVKNSYSIAQTCRKLGIVAIGGNYKTIKKYIQVFELDISHFTGQGHLSGKTHNFAKKSTTNEELFIENYLGGIAGTDIKKRLIKDYGFENKCKICGIIDWNNGPIVFHLDHINGTNNDNRVENLRLVCPNCHSQTKTFSGKNKTPNYSNNKNVDKSIKIHRLFGIATKNKVEKECLYCNQSFSSKRKESKYCSTACYHKSGKGRPGKTKINWPEMSILIEMIKGESFLAVAKKLGVSDNAVRKRLQFHGISTKTLEPLI